MKSPVNLDRYRKKKSKERILAALEAMYFDILAHLEDEKGQIHPDEMEEFLVQVLVDHLTGNLENCSDYAALDHHYRRFDHRLRAGLHTRLKSMRHFQNLKK